MIRLQNAGKSFATKTLRTLALNNISLSVEMGEFVAVMGPSGSGKTTLLNVMGLFEQLDKGTLEVLSTDVTTLSYSKRVGLRREAIGYIFQAFNLIAHMSVFENIELPLEYRGIEKAERKTRVMATIEKFGLDNRAFHRPSQLSGGQQQRVAIARAVISKPKLILADEPTGNLDSVNGKIVLDELKQINQAGTTIIMVTHSDDAAKNASRVLIMRDGSLQ